MTLLNLTDESVQKVRDAASALMKPADIAALLGLNRDETEYFLFAIRENCDTDFARAYHSGRMETKLQLHESVVKLALKGSPAAQPIAETYLREQEL